MFYNLRMSYSLTAQRLAKAQKLRLAGYHNLKIHQTTKVQEVSLVHIFEDMTNASVLSEKKLPLLDVDGWSLQGKLARARAGQAGSIWG